MNDRGGSRARVLCVGLGADPGDEQPCRFEVRAVETATAAREVFEENSNDVPAWYPDCVVSAAVLSDSKPDADRWSATGLDLLRWVDDHTERVATVLAPFDGSERLASRALDAGLSGYCPTDGSLAAAVQDALDRDVRSRELDHSADRRYRTLAENLPNGAVALYDQELRYLVVGGTVFDELPLDREQLEGRRLEDVHSPAYLDEYGPLYRAALDGTRSEFEFTYEDRTFRGHNVPVRDRTGEVVAGMTLTQDITDEREQWAQLERQNERLDRFASVVSHDLRTPLNVVEGSLALLQDAVAAGDRDTVDENVERISRACQSMNDIVDNVLTLARQSETSESLDDVPFDDTVTRVWESIDAPDATLSVEVGADRGLAVRADQSAFYRVLENLLSNAVEHGSTGEDSVTVRVEWFDDETQGFAVADDGPGLSPDARGRAFEWGYTTDGSEKGVGFGLSIVQEVAETHGWTVSATESEAGGVRFEVRGVERAEVGRSVTDSPRKPSSLTETAGRGDE